MLIFLIFIAPLALICILAAVRGGKDERIGAASFAIAYLATVIADGQTAGRIEQPEWAVAAVDLALTVPLLYLALFSSRFWPIWALAFHLVTLLTHLAAWMQPEILAKAYAVSLSFWSFPTMGALLVALLTKGRSAFGGAWSSSDRSQASGVQG